MGSGTYQVEVVEVNELDTFPSGMNVPGFSAVSNEHSVSCPSGGEITVTAPATLGSGTFAGQDFRVFVTVAGGASGTETLQVPGTNLSCTAGVVDTTYGCELGTNAVVKGITGGGDSPNLVDLSNPLVVEIGPVINGAPEGFWARLQNLTLALPSSATSNDPNVAFWNPSDQENSGLSFVGFAGQTSSASTGLTAAWIYIGPHAPNSFVSNVQTDTNPMSGTFYGVILDGRPGFGTSGTARVVTNSTFTPGPVTGSTATIPAGILITGTNALTDFNQVHVETPSSADSNFDVTNGASVAVVGPTQFANTANPIVHLTSTGTAIAVKNVSAPSGVQVIKDDVNGVNNLGSYVANYSSSLQAGTLRAFTSLTLPNQTANLIYAGPSSGPAAAPSFRSMVAADLPTGGTVQVLAAGLPSVSSGTNSVYLAWLGGGSAASASTLSSMIASGGTITGLFVGVSATYTNAVTFTVASCTPSSSVNCSAATDSNLTCTISGTAEQCNDTNAAHALSVSAGDEVFLHVTTTGASIPTRSVFMSYRLAGVQ